MIAWTARDVVVRIAAAGALTAGLGAVHIPRPATLCPLRAATGIPCPGCGTTTALARLGRLDVGTALAANPFTLSALLALVLAPALLPRVRPAWARVPVPTQLALGALLVLGAWSWQLVRFDVLSW